MYTAPSLHLFQLFQCRRLRKILLITFSGRHALPQSNNETIFGHLLFTIITISLVDVLVSTHLLLHTFDQEKSENDTGKDWGGESERKPEAGSSKLKDGLQSWRCVTAGPLVRLNEHDQRRRRKCAVTFSLFQSCCALLLFSKQVGLQFKASL